MHNRNQTHPKPNTPNSVSNRFIDFWLLGGASILVFLIMYVGNFFRADSQLVQQKFFVMIPLFGFLSILCNHPHFIISYRFGYSRGWHFLLKYWFSLVIVPMLMLVLYITAYTNFDADVSQNYLVVAINQALETAGLSYRFGESATFGKELMSLSIWIMYLTVGWHYSKQIYGCMMVYNKYDNYDLSQIEKKTIKFSLLALSLFQFLHSSRQMDQASVSGYQDPRFAGIQILPLGLPDWLYMGSQIFASIFFFFVLSIFVTRYLSKRKIPSGIFIVSWLSIYFWWIQVINLPEYYYLAVPFFHSLQYLPFAAKMEAKKIPANRWTPIQISLRIIIVLVLGFLFFELIPSTLDTQLDTDITKTAWFFVTAFSVFINIHHFFIDSVVWRLQQPAVAKGLFSQ